MGRLQRKLGLTIDSLLAVELVTCDGRLVRASEDENPDLFWACAARARTSGSRPRSSSGSTARGEVTGTVIHAAERAGKLAERFREVVETGPDELWALLRARAGRRTADRVRLRPPRARPDGAERDLAPAARARPALVGSIEPKPYLTTQRLNDDAMEWGHRFYMRSAFLSALPDELVHAWADHVTRVPEGADGGYSNWSWGRAIATVPEEETAFTGRDAAFWSAVEIQWDDPELDDACRAWARAAMAEAQRQASVGRYVNDVADVEADAVRSIYGDAKQERLVALKRAWDPDHVPAQPEHQALSLRSDEEP